MSTSVHESFGSWLKQRRREAGITRDELAERTACSSITLQKIEAGERRPSRQIALSLAELFHVPSDEHEAFVVFARAAIGSQQAQQAHPPTPKESGAGPGALVSLPLEPDAAASVQAQTRSPWRALRVSKTNLPALLTDLIGRGRDEAILHDLLTRPRTRLLTLTGAPGIGKTRLAEELAAGMVGHFEDGVYLVELAPVSEPDMVIPTVARALSVREMIGLSIDEALLSYIRDKRLLLVLDNFEQVLDAAPDVVKLLEASPWLKVLVTSREALHVRGEVCFSVPPLQLPARTGRPSLEELAHNPAVELFVERARAARSDFRLTDANALDIAAVCVGLDGLPLAIELAAARVGVLSPPQIRASLDNRLRLLAHGARDLPPRQRTLRSAIEWSYDLLCDGEKQLFRRAAVFHGGRTLQAIEAVCNSAGDLRVGALEGMGSLLSKSLLQQRDGSDGEPRFWMLETIHEYAREKLQESEEADTLYREHALYFMRLAEVAQPHLTGKEQQEWLDRLEDEYDNIKAALQWARVNRGRSRAEDTETGLRLACAVLHFWHVRGYYSEGREHLEKLMALQQTRERERADTERTEQVRESRKHRATALNGAGMLAWSQGDYVTARALMEEGLSIRRELEDKKSITTSLNNLGNVAFEQGDYVTAHALHEESLSMQRELEDKPGIASSLHGMGMVAYQQEDYSAARALMEGGLSIRRELGDKKSITVSLRNLGLVAHHQGDYSAARSLYEESLSLQREIGDKRGIAYSLIGMGTVAYQQEDYSAARSLYEESLSGCREIGDKKGIAISLAGLGEAAVSTGDTERGAKVLGAVEAQFAELGAVFVREDRLQLEGAIASARSVLGEEAFERAWQEGWTMSLEAAVDYALEEGPTNVEEAIEYALQQGTHE